VIDQLFWNEGGLTIERLRIVSTSRFRARVSTFPRVRQSCCGKCT